MTNVRALGGRRACVATALLCALLGWALQFLIVHGRFGGNWTALYCTGASFPVPPALAGENIYVFPNSTGYDGQMYHYVAHDPWVRTNLWQSMDNSRVRYRRILLPALAYLLALGRQAWIDPAYIAVNLLFLFLGAWWLGRYLDSLGLDCRWAALYILAPAALVSLDRLAVDLAFTSLCIGFALYLRWGRQVAACALLALACLSRDTGFVLAAAACLAMVWGRRFLKALQCAAATLPALAWYGFVFLRTPDYSDARFGQLIPLRGIFAALLHPLAYPFGAATNAALGWLDRLTILGFLLAALLTIWLIRRQGVGPMEAAIVLWCLVGLSLPVDSWTDSYSSTRVFTPVLLYFMLRALPLLGWRATLPLMLTMPRVALQVVGPLLLALAAHRH